MCDIVFEQAKGHGRKVNRATAYAKGLCLSKLL